MFPYQVVIGFILLLLRVPIVAVKPLSRLESVMVDKDVASDEQLVTSIAQPYGDVQIVTTRQGFIPRFTINSNLV